MGKKSKGQTVTNNTITEPWAAAQPALKEALSAGRDLFGSGGFKVDPYTGQRVAPYSAMTQGGIQALGATANNPLTPAAQSALMSNLNMDDSYRDMDLIRESVVDDVKSNLANTFAGGGVNSGLAGGYANAEMARALAGVEYDQYNRAKQRQMEATAMSPMVSNLARADAGAALTAGGMTDDMQQRLIDAEMQKYYETANTDMDELNRYSAFAMGLGGMGGSGSSTSKQPYQGPSTIGKIAGGGATGLGTYGLLAANPATAPFAIGGGILAGLGSIF